MIEEEFFDVYLICKELPIIIYVELIASMASMQLQQALSICNSLRPGSSAENGGKGVFLDFWRF